MRSTIAVWAAGLVMVLVAREAIRAQGRRVVPRLVDFGLIVAVVGSALVLAPTLWTLLT